FCERRIRLRRSKRDWRSDVCSSDLNCLTTIRRLLNLGVLKIDVEDVLIGVMAQKILYQESSHEPIILVEYLNRTMIKQFFKEGHVEYTTFKDNAKYLLENGLVDQKQLTGVFYE